MASPFPRLTAPHFFAPVKRCAFSLSGAKKRQLPRTLSEIRTRIVGESIQKILDG